MNFKSLYAIILLLVVFVIIFPLTPPRVSAFAGAYYEVLPELKEFGPSPCEGQEFTVAVWLKNVTTQTVPNGVFGVEIKLQWNKTYLEFKSRTLKIGVSGGVLNSPYFTAKDELNSITIDTYWIAASSLYGASPWFGNGVVAEFTFKIIKQPKQLLGENDVEIPIKLIFTDLVDSQAKPVLNHFRKDGSVVLHAMPFIVTYEYTVWVDSRSFKITIECNATTGSVKFNTTEKVLTFQLETYLGYAAFCNVSVPKTFMWVDSLSDWRVKVNEMAISFEAVENQTHTMLYFIVSEENAKVIVISGKYVWPAIIIHQQCIRLDGRDFIILFKTNATSITNVALNKTSAEIIFSAKTHSQKTAFFNVTIPKELLWADSLEEWNVKIDGASEALNLNKLENETHTIIYFECLEGIHQVSIKGKYVWSPQGLPYWIIPTMAVVIIAAIIIAVVSVKKPKKKA